MVRDGISSPVSHRAYPVTIVRTGYCAGLRTCPHPTGTIIGGEPQIALGDLARLIRRPAGCYRPRYLNIQRLNYLWTIRHSSARIAGNLVT